MSAIRIFLVRHGETEWNRIHRFQGRSDVPLNQIGKDQAHALALALKDEPIMAIYASPLVRALETANLIKSFHPSIPLFEEPGLIEMDLGEFDGMEAGLWVEQYPHFRKAWQETPSSLKMPGGESLQEVQTRAIDTLERITQNYPPQSTLLLSSHNFVNRTILCHALGKPLDRFRELKQRTAALNILYKQDKKLWAEVIDDQSHLQSYLPSR
ncbi:histidine phosphatase family protein [bacterium]|nr:histidine phosphatase family protein [bacterium]